MYYYVSEETVFMDGDDMEKLKEICKKINVYAVALALMAIALIIAAVVSVMSGFGFTEANAETSIPQETLPEAVVETEAASEPDTAVPTGPIEPGVTTAIDNGGPEYPEGITGIGRAITAVNSRTAPDSEAPVYRIIAQGEAVAITGYSGQFAEVGMDGGRYYVLSKYLVPDKYENMQTDKFGCSLDVLFDGIGWTGDRSDLRPVAFVKHHPTAFRLSLYNVPSDLTGSVEYKAYMRNEGWTTVLSDGAVCGNESADSFIEAVCVSLTGRAAETYDIYVKVLSGGTWGSWFKNGDICGTPGGQAAIDGICVSVREKDAGAPPFKIHDVDPEKPMVALTYDDGPSAESTNIILDALSEVGGRATFFLIGSQIYGENNNCVNREVQMGCEVGTHTYDHENLTHISDADVRHTALKCKYLIQFTSGIEADILRAPGGNCNDATLASLRRVNLPNIMWSVDPQDWKNRDADYVHDTIMGCVGDGDIVLMHDIHMTTAEASKRLIPELTEAGYQLVTVSELAAYHGGMTSGGQYSRFRSR